MKTDKLKEKFAKVALPMAAELKDFIKENGNHVIGSYTIEQVYSGMKGMIRMVTETSKLDPEEGIRFRGYSIPELREKLPKAPVIRNRYRKVSSTLMLIGEIPTDEEATYVSNQWARRTTFPHVFDMLDKLPANTHPMTQFSMAVMALQTESVSPALTGRASVKEYWDPMYEDVMNLIAVYRAWPRTSIVGSIRMAFILNRTPNWIGLRISPTCWGTTITT